jgi:thiamine biosynthesis lipoprotein
MSSGRSNDTSLRGLRRRDFLKMAAIGGAALAVPILGSRVAGSLARPTSGRQGTQAFETSFDAMGTTITIRIEDAGFLARASTVATVSDYTSNASGLNDTPDAVKSAIDEINRLETVLTRFPGGTDVVKLNQCGLLEIPSKDVVSVLESSTSYSERTEGRFDITVKPVLDMLQSYLDGQQPFPSDAQFEQARSLIGYEGLHVSSKLVTCSRPGMGVTLDGIGTGYVLDRTISILKSSGVRSGYVNVGGTVALIGSRGDGNPWRVGIVDPLAPAQTIGTLELSKDAVVATSGDYENYYTADKSYYHIIDPARARSPLYSHSATVVAASGIEADPLGVILMLEDDPGTETRRVADSFPFEYLVYTRTSGIVTSPGMEQLLK